MQQLTHSGSLRISRKKPQRFFPLNDFVTLTFHTCKSHLPNWASFFWLFLKGDVGGWRFTLRKIEENVWYPSVVAIGNTFFSPPEKKGAMITASYQKAHGAIYKSIKYSTLLPGFLFGGRIKSESTCTGLVLLSCKYV